MCDGVRLYDFAIDILQLCKILIKKNVVVVAVDLVAVVVASFCWCCFRFENRFVSLDPKTELAKRWTYDKDRCFARSKGRGS